MATISTHHGSKVAREHNLRNPKVVSKEAHIVQDGEHETWLDESPRAAYRRIFGDAQKEYNDKQTRDDRKIKSYYDKIAGDGKKHPVYEMIVGVYGEGISDELKKQIMKEYIAGWKERNPNMELIGVYWHNDEQGGAHLHIDYIPVARECTRGMRVQTGQKAALAEMGIKGGPKRTAQVIWQSMENKTLENICNAHGITIEHPQRDGKPREHLDTSLYKQAAEAAKEASQEAQKAAQARDTAQDEYEALQAKISALEADKRAAEAKAAEAEKKAQEASESLVEAQKELAVARAEKAEVEAFVHEVEAVLEQGEKRKWPVPPKIFQAVSGLAKRFSDLFKREDEVKSREEAVKKREVAATETEKAAKEHLKAAVDKNAKAHALLNHAWAQAHPIITDAVRGTIEDMLQRQPMYQVFRNWATKNGLSNVVEKFETTVDYWATVDAEKRLREQYPETPRQPQTHAHDRGDDAR